VPAFYDDRILMILAGTPAAIESGGKSLVTTLPAPTTELSPIDMPGRMVELAPTHTLLPKVTLLKISGKPGSS
jgi:hypothetical protein